MLERFIVRKAGGVSAISVFCQHLSETRALAEWARGQGHPCRFEGCSARGRHTVRRDFYRRVTSTFPARQEPKRLVRLAQPRTVSRAFADARRTHKGLSVNLAPVKPRTSNLLIRSLKKRPPRQASHLLVSRKL